MVNRKRNKQIIVRVTEEERELIELKMAQLPTAQLGAYMRSWTKGDVDKRDKRGRTYSVISAR